MEWCKTLMLLLFGLSFTFCSHFPFRKYYYISSPKTWKDAQLYCREIHTDLATFESMEELNQLSRPASITPTAWVYIGLHDDPASWKGTLGNDSNSWRWSTTGQPITSQYHNWMSGRPNYVSGKEECVLFYRTGEWNDDFCYLHKTSVCYTDLGLNQKTYVFISVEKKWSDAQTYCRHHYTDLAVITSSEENSRVQAFLPDTIVGAWIGLYRVPWTWSDKNPSTFKKWGPAQPNNAGEDQHCVVETGSHAWLDEPCGTLRPFICHEVRKSKNTIKLKMKTTADLTDPAVNELILQKINAALKSQGWTDLKLGWTTLPGKAKEKPPRTAFVG